MSVTYCIGPSYDPDRVTFCVDMADSKMPEEVRRVFETHDGPRSAGSLSNTQYDVLIPNVEVVEAALAALGAVYVPESPWWISPPRNDGNTLFWVKMIIPRGETVSPKAAMVAKIFDTITLETEVCAVDPEITTYLVRDEYVEGVKAALDAVDSAHRAAMAAEYQVSLVSNPKRFLEELEWDKMRDKAEKHMRQMKEAGGAMD